MRSRLAIKMLHGTFRQGSYLLPRNIASTSSPGCAAWPVRDKADGSLRAILINKDANNACTVSLSLNSFKYSSAVVVRLLGASLLANMNDISLGGKVRSWDDYQSRWAGNCLSSWDQAVLFHFKRFYYFD